MSIAFSILTFHECSPLLSIRHPYEDPTPPPYFNDYLNIAYVQNALGVDVNYTQSNNDVYYAFQKTGDFAYPTFIPDLEMILNNSVRVSLVYGDADYICNWFGGEAASLNISYTHSAEFKAAEYAPFVVDGTEYGAVRQYGNFSFARIYDAGHEMPYYQPLAALEMFRRLSANVDFATGQTTITGMYNTSGEPEATHTNEYVAIPSATESGVSRSYTAAITNPITSVLEEDLAPASTAAQASSSSSSSSSDVVMMPPKGPNFAKRTIEDLL